MSFGATTVGLQENGKQPKEAKQKESKTQTTNYTLAELETLHNISNEPEDIMPPVQVR